MAKVSSNILLPYENKWVAVSKDGKKVVAAASGIDALVKKLKGFEKESVVLTKVFPFDAYYSPNVG
ncbi:MAG: DUF5678 domain-containing protein [Patescibacteria group bacterium]